MRKSFLPSKKLFVISLLSAVVILPATYYLVQEKDAVSATLWDKLNCGICVFYLQPDDPQLFFDIGNYYFGGGAYNLEKAEYYLRQSLVIDPGVAGAHYQIARVHFIRGEFSTALDEINKEIELHPDFKRSYYVRGLIYGYNRQFKEAEADFKEFLRWKPESWAGNNDLAWIYFQEGKYAEARDAVRAGLKIAPDNPWLLNSLGVALLNTGDKEGAKNAFTRALAVLGSLSEADWGAAYPGNDPGVYAEGLSQMKASLETNLELLDGGDINTPG
ncbi:MAG: tetratricopeptide repeat protein [Candidatus Paceibacterota bacterium]|jgi:tetratricopeptide (TPR) repeat protein